MLAYVLSLSFLSLCLSSFLLTSRAEKAKSEEESYLTLDEWKAQQAQMSKPKVFSNLRKANEGADTKQWKKFTPLEKKKKGEETDEEYEEYTDEDDAVSLGLSSFPISFILNNTMLSGLEN